jgi:hypothetical protein
MASCRCCVHLPQSEVDQDSESDQLDRNRQQAAYCSNSRTYLVHISLYKMKTGTANDTRLHLLVYLLRSYWSALRIASSTRNPPPTPASSVFCFDYFGVTNRL